MSNLFAGLYVPLGYAQFNSAAMVAGVVLKTTAPTTGFAFPAASAVQPKFALISVEGVNARWRDDGVAPTTAIGMVMVFGAEPQGFTGDLSALQFIALTGCTLNVSYYG